jgi:hypothetical protein
MAFSLTRLRLLPLQCVVSSLPRPVILGFVTRPNVNGLFRASRGLCFTSLFARITAFVSQLAPSGRHHPSLHLYNSTTVSWSG